MWSAQSGDSVLPPAGARRCEANHRGIEGAHQAQCAVVSRWREEHTLIERQNLGPSNVIGLRGELGITIKDPPPESGRRTHLLHFTNLYCMLSSVWNFPLHCFFDFTEWHYEHLFLFSMLILHVASSQFCLCLLNIYHFAYTFSHAHTKTHTHKHICMISTQEEWRQPGTGAWLRGAEETLSLKSKACTHTKKRREKYQNVRKNPIFTNPKKRIRAHRAFRKATGLFLTK